MRIRLNEEDKRKNTEIGRGVSKERRRDVGREEGMEEEEGA